MNKRHRRGIVGTVALLAAATLAPGSVTAAGPGTTSGTVANGQPANDTQLSVHTGAAAAFMQYKLGLAASLSGEPAATASGKSSGATPMAECEFDPCEDPSPPWPQPSGPPAALTLGTKARQQAKSYWCGPASGQVVINWTRGITSGNNDGEDPTTNWRTQSKIAQWMNTTTAGTGGANLAAGLNHPNAVLKPVANWVYSYADTGNAEEFHDKVITDVWKFGMPLVLATVPHDANAGIYHLESWPTQRPGAHHWIVIRGYDGLWDSPSPTLKYQDSSGGYGGATGAFDDLVAVMWQVNKWNNGGNIVW